MKRPLASAAAMAFLALGSMSVYADDSGVPVASESPPAAVVSLPRFVPPSGKFYPRGAASRLEQGSVGIEFLIDEKGRAQILAQTFADDPDFAPKAAAFLTKGHFKISPDWVQSGGPGVRFAVEVQFSIARGGDPCEQKPPHVADTEVLVVCHALPSRRRGRL